MNWNRFIAALVAGVLVSGCWAVTVMFKARCIHQDLIIEKCVIYPRISRDK